jgi:beta-lactamase regulating signal transducer with metallopeptidase domain
MTLDPMTLAGFALRTSLLIGATGLLSLALRRRSAAFRHLLWISALALSVLMPLAVLYLPSYTLVTLTTAPASAPGTSAAGGSMIVALWIFGSLCFLTREGLASLSLVRWRRRAYPLSSARWASTLARISVEQGFDCQLRVLESTQIASPCVWGLFHPVLLLPAAGDAWSESARRNALLHELAHVRRFDALGAFVSRIACALHWYNPLVWLAVARVRSLQERACDDAVLRTGQVPSEYAQCLLDIAAQTSGLGSPRRIVLGMAHGSSLRARIVAILDPHATRSQAQRVSAFVACISLLGLTLFLAMASVATEADTDQELPSQSTQRDPPPLSPLPELPELPASRVPPVPPVPPVLPTPPTPSTSPAR